MVRQYIRKIPHKNPIRLLSVLEVGQQQFNFADVINAIPAHVTGSSISSCNGTGQCSVIIMKNLERK